MFHAHDHVGFMGHVIAGVIFRQLFDFDGSSVVIGAPPSAPSLGSAASLHHNSSGAYGFARQPAVHPSGAARRRDIVQCRSLRAIIQGYESQFEATHGRKPRGGDRGRLADTYTQYRALKQRIRDDAANHIQCVWRGHIYRKSTGAVRRKATASVAPSSGTPAKTAPSAPATAFSGNVPSSPAAPAPGGTPVNMRSRLEQLRAEKSGLKAALRTFDTKFAEKHGRNPRKDEKEHLRPQYQRYHDLKALIGTLEAAITGTGGGGGGVTPGGAAPAPTPLGPAGIGNVSALSQHSSDSASAASPWPSAPQSAPPTGARAGPGAGSRAHSSGGDAMLGADAPISRVSSASEATSGLARSTSAPQLSGVPASPLGGSVGSVPFSPAGSSSSSHFPDGGGLGSAGGGTPLSSSAAAGGDPMRELRGEKKRLQLFLRDYEKAFEAREGRKVQYVRDIEPVLAQYQRYKVLKGAIKEVGGGE